MQSSSRQIWAIDAQIFQHNEWNKIVILLYCENIEICYGLMLRYCQLNQVRLKYQLSPLPLENYLQWHGDETLVSALREECQRLSDDNQILLFNPNTYRFTDREKLPCLTKNEILVRQYDNNDKPILLSGIPQSVIPFLWTDNQESKCYVIIHAARSFWFPGRFQQGNIRYACLYKGEEANKKANTAPYLVELPADHSFTRSLFCEDLPETGDGFNHWNKHFGVFFRSGADIERLVDHFRHFIFMPTYDGRTLYFQFFDPAGLENYLDNLIYYPKKLATFFGRNLIESFAIPKGNYLITYKPTVNLAEFEYAKKQFDKFEMEMFIQQRNQKLLNGLVDEILQTMPAIMQYYDKEAVIKTVLYCYKICREHKMYQTVSIGVFALISLTYSQMIDILDPEKQINKIIQSEVTEQEKLYLIQTRIDELENKGNIYDRSKAAQNE